MKTETSVIIVLLILALATLSIFAYSKYRDNQKFFVYHGAHGDYRIEFTKTGNQTDYYVYALSQQTLYKTPLRKSPNDVENIPLELNLLDKIQRPEGTEKVYITQDYETPNKTGQLSFIGILDIGKILGNAEYGIYKLNTEAALTTSTQKSKDLFIPQITCANVNATTSVIYLALGNQNRIFSKNDCIIVEGKDADGIVLSSTKFAYYLLGVF